MVGLTILFVSLVVYPPLFENSNNNHRKQWYEGHKRRVCLNLRNKLQNAVAKVENVHYVKELKDQRMRQKGKSICRIKVKVAYAVYLVVFIKLAG